MIQSQMTPELEAKLAWLPYGAKYFPTLSELIQMGLTESQSLPLTALLS